MKENITLQKPYPKHSFFSQTNSRNKKLKLQLSRAIAGAVFSRLASAQSSSPSSSPSSSFPLVGEKYWERDCGEGGSSGASGDASGSVIIETAHVGELGGGWRAEGSTWTLGLLE